jgi:hypothetical protein
MKLLHLAELDGAETGERAMELFERLFREQYGGEMNRVQAERVSGLLGEDNE